MTESKHGPARKGSLYWTKSGWRGRIRVEVDGVVVQKSYDLGTRDRAAAKAKLRRLVALNKPPEIAQAKAAVTVDEFGLDWLKSRVARGIRAATYEQRYYERIWQPVLGKMPMTEVSVSEVNDVLDDLANGEIRALPRNNDEEPGPYSRQSIAHIRATLVRMFQAATRLELVPTNKPALTTVPDMEEALLPRAVLTDDEIGRLLAHPEVDAEIKMLVLLSRTIGGLRAGDLNSLDWTAFSPEFTTCTFVRRKTREKRPLPETLIVPAPVRPFLAVWWERQDTPTAGPVFPVRKGPRAGELKKASSMSYAARLRRELLVAGVDRHELHHETTSTLPVDFHSTRRAYATALARIGTNAQTSMALTGHSDAKTHQRCLASLPAEMPADAVPQLCIDYAQLLRRTANQNHNLAIFPERDIGFEPTTSSLGSSCSTN
jgi:integrase